MKISSDIRSPNFTDLEIGVEFLVVHYSAANLQRTLDIFKSPTSEVSAHIVIDKDGAVYELVPCLDGKAMRAWHAGRSRLEVSTRQGPRVVESFNDRSIGVELINENGNIFPYTERQYRSLFAVIERLKALYPALHHPESIVGHEQIAGFRGKCDPGLLFEWARLFAFCYPDQGAPTRGAVASQAFVEKLSGLVLALGVTRDADTGELRIPKGVNPLIFEQLSALSESAFARQD